MDVRDWFKSLRKPARTSGRLHPESDFVVTVSDDKVMCLHPDGYAEAIRFEDLKEVLILTTDEGPMHPDVFWLLVGNDIEVTIPQGATGEKTLLSKLQTLPGFDNQAFIDAMSSTENQKFLCWKKL